MVLWILAGVAISSINRKTGWRDGISFRAPGKLAFVWIPPTQSKRWRRKLGTCEFYRLLASTMVLQILTWRFFFRNTIPWLAVPCMTRFSAGNYIPRLVKVFRRLWVSSNNSGGSVTPHKVCLNTCQPQTRAYGMRGKVKDVIIVRWEKLLQQFAVWTSLTLRPLDWVAKINFARRVAGIEG